MNDDGDNIPRVDAAVPPAPDVPTVPRGGGAPITEDAELQTDEVAPEPDLTVRHTETARAVEEGLSPFGGLAPDRPDRATLDNSPDVNDVRDNYY